MTFCNNFALKSFDWGSHIRLWKKLECVYVCVFFRKGGGVRTDNTTEYKRAEQKEQMGRREVEDLDLKRVIPFH